MDTTEDSKVTSKMTKMTLLSEELEEEAPTNTATRTTINHKLQIKYSSHA